MQNTTAQTAEQYLADLPADRRAVVAAVREVILANLPAGFVETVNWGMLSYEVPLARYPQTYNGQPLSYAALAAQKHHYAVYLTCAYANQAVKEALVAAFAAAGKKLDMGKSCVRFKKLADLPLEVIGAEIGRLTVDQFIAHYEAARVQGRGNC
ncbi:MAG: DUF1801 domain-containing protein [Fimbriimonadaceae bacterium]|nr:DUF1801 domain-containing protein [Fimbriimonadaceae bacterium]